jgi:hypothetical protein
MNTSSKQGHHKFIAASRATSYSPTSYRDLLRVEEFFPGQPSNNPIISIGKPLMLDIKKIYFRRAAINLSPNLEYISEQLQKLKTELN